MHERFLNQRIVVMSERYIWRGLATEIAGPAIFLKEKSLVVRHNKTSIMEEVEWGDGWVNVERAEDVSFESGMEWIPKAKKARGS